MLYFSLIVFLLNGKTLPFNVYLLQSGKMQKERINTIRSFSDEIMVTELNLQVNTNITGICQSVIIINVHLFLPYE